MTLSKNQRSQRRNSHLQKSFTTMPVVASVNESEQYQARLRYVPDILRQHASLAFHGTCIILF